MDLSNVSNQRRWSIVGLLFTASVINYLDRAAISFALPLISRDFHLTPETKGLLLSSFFWSYALMQVPIGWCADRFNLRWLYAGAFALWSLAQGLTGLAESLAVLIGFRILLGVGESIYLPGGTKIVSVLFSGRARPALGTFRFWNANRVGPRRHPGPVAPGALRLASHISSVGLYRSALDHPLALGFSPPHASGGTGRGFPSPPRGRLPWMQWSLCSTAICWASAWDFSALTTTGTCWSRGCPTTWSRYATSASCRPASTLRWRSSPSECPNRLEDGSPTA